MMTGFWCLEGTLESTRMLPPATGRPGMRAPGCAPLDARPRIMPGASRNCISLEARVMVTIEELYEIYLRHPQIQTDTRLLKPGDIFFALKGPNFNGNSFASRALELGAAYAVIDEKPATGVDANGSTAGNPRLLLVGDVLTT